MTLEEHVLFRASALGLANREGVLHVELPLRILPPSIIDRVEHLRPEVSGRGFMNQGLGASGR